MGDYIMTDYSLSVRGSATSKKNILYKTDGSTAKPYFWRRVEDEVNKYTPFFIEDISGEENTVTFSSTKNTFSVQVSTDGTLWNDLGSITTTGTTYNIQPYHKLYVRTNTTAWSYYSSVPGNSFDAHIRCSGRHNVGGNIMSLLYGSDFTGEETKYKDVVYDSNHHYYGSFRSLFYDNTTLVSASDLILAEDISNVDSGVYAYMFSGCTSLTTPPKIEVTKTLAQSCFNGMFRNCTSLTSDALPNLHWTELAPYCYDSMFYGCTSLTTPPELPAITLPGSCYQAMFKNCTSLVSAPDILSTQRPDLSRIKEMFYGCTSLKSFVCLMLPYRYDGDYYKNFLFSTEGGTFYKNPSADWLRGGNYIPYSWTIVDYTG